MKVDNLNTYLFCSFHMKQFIIYVLAVAGLSACKKDKIPSKMELLTEKSWQLTSASTEQTSTIIASGASRQDSYNDYALMPYCERDDIYKFTTDNQLSIEEGITKCFPYSNPPVIRQWKFNNDQTTLHIVPFQRLFGYSENKIAELSASTMHLHRTDVDTLNGTIFKKESDMLFSTAQ